MKKYLFIGVFFILGICNTAFAISDTFTASLLIGEDTTPPTTPTFLTAIPVAQTQIDLAWTASTDNFLLGGYQVFRDAVQIATTTLTSYSDSGLTANTTYSYFVKAFDSAFNVSSSSNVVSTTTLAVIATSTPPVPEDNRGYNNKSPDLLSFSIVPDIKSVEVKWRTSEYAQFEFRWGRSSSFELGFVSNDIFKRGHSTVITELEPGTTYEYQLISYDKNGRTKILSKGRFTTLEQPDTLAPNNVSNLRAVVQDADTALSWVNPLDADFSHVRIVRSHLFYPTDPYDGFIAYIGNDSSFIDRDAFTSHDTLYYTVFAYDKNGNISSGAVVTSYKNKQVKITPSTIATSSLTIRFTDIEFLQNNKHVDTTEVLLDLPLTIRIAYEKLPEHLKTITVSLQHPHEEDTEFTFLLKINKNKTYYEATLAGLQTVGLYPVLVSIFDHQAQILTTVTGFVSVVRVSTQETLLGVPLVTQMVTSQEFAPFFWVFLFLLLLYIFYRFFRDVILGHEVYGVFTKTHPLFAVLLFVILCGIVVYLFSSAGNLFGF